MINNNNNTNIIWITIYFNIFNMIVVYIEFIFARVNVLFSLIWLCAALPKNCVDIYPTCKHFTKVYVLYTYGFPPSYTCE